MTSYTIRVLQPIALFTAACAASFVVAHATPAQASRAIVHATACMIETDYMGDYKISASGIANASGSSGVDPGARARRVFCPLPDETYNSINQTVPESRTDVLYVSGVDSNNSVPNHTNYEQDGRAIAQTCVRSYGGAPALCSYWVELTSGTYTGAFDTNIAAWTGANDPVPFVKAYPDYYPVLVVNLPKSGIYGWSSLSGFSTF
ncbi:hypothetical protein [Polyangium mundeleinium]|uniref:Secreted protein n=1 Tax=Polyangium mundeleinium TaxID=2995306 RepID=A0ABT5EY76_9BACT|nr:hypothetical protein [Polyangium mundeleinium]MDC0746746.1 hypothetical protein [Polyangium mundeleinium]